MKRIIPTLLAVLIVSPEAVAQVSQLPPDVDRAFWEMGQVAQTFCSMGNQQACGEMQSLNQGYAQLQWTAGACNNGDQNACFQFQAAMPQLEQAYQRYAALWQSLQQPAPGSAASLPPDQFRQWQTQQHQQLMQNFDNARAARERNMSQFRQGLGLD